MEIYRSGMSAVMHEPIYASLHTHTQPLMWISKTVCIVIYCTSGLVGGSDAEVFKCCVLDINEQSLHHIHLLSFLPSTWISLLSLLGPIQNARWNISNGRAARTRFTLREQRWQDFTTSFHFKTSPSVKQFTVYRFFIFLANAWQTHLFAFGPVYSWTSL